MQQDLVMESKFVNCFFEDETGLMIAQWLKNTVAGTRKDFYYHNLILVNICEKYRPIFWLTDMQDSGFVVDTEAQEWIDRELVPKFQRLGIKKMAFLTKNISEELEQLLQQKNMKQAFKTAIFSDEKEARQWLLTV